MAINQYRKPLIKPSRLIYLLFGQFYRSGTRCGHFLRKLRENCELEVESNRNIVSHSAFVNNSSDRKIWDRKIISYFSVPYFSVGASRSSRNDDQRPSTFHRNLSLVKIPSCLISLAFS